MKSRLATPLLAIALLAPLAGWAQISIAIAIRPPPPLPVYVQPPVPAPGYLWTPGYWAWSEPESDHYWVPGTWVLAPTPGYLWTPGYWAFTGGGYRWNRGYWATRVGFYGGINYGFGYTGSGYHGGRWDRGVFHYNQAVNNVNTTVVRNVYNTKVVNVSHVTQVQRVSFNGGPQGVAARPTEDDERVKTVRHIDPTPNQVEHEKKARETRPTNNKADRLDNTGPNDANDTNGARTTPKNLNADDRKTVQPRPGATDAAPQSAQPGPPASRKGNDKPSAEPAATDEPRPQPQPKKQAEPRAKDASGGKARQGEGG